MKFKEEMGEWDLEIGTRCDVGKLELAGRR